MKRITFARLTVLLLAAGALALSGCGGDDNGVDQSLHDTVTAERDAAQIKADDATARADKAEADLKEAEGVPAEDSAAQMQLAEVMRKEDNTRGARITKAMRDFYSLHDHDGDSARDSPTDEIMAYMDLDEAPTGLMLKHTSADGLTITPTEKPLEFEEYMPAAGSPMIDGWQDQTLTRRNNADNADQTVYAYTDIEAATMKTFGAVHGTKVNFGAEVTADTPGKIALAKSSEFPTLGGAGQSNAQTYADIDVDFAGTYDGVAGTFGCPREGCMVTVTVTVAGKLTVSVESPLDVLVFTPTNSSDMVMVADSQHLYFGYWLHKPENANGAHPFATFAGGGDAYTVNTGTIGGTPGAASNISTKIGRAKYEGPAAGKYVIRELSKDSTTIGLFTASAQLIADFEAPSPAEVRAAAAADANTEAIMAAARGATQEGTLSGMISDFMDKDDKSLGNWRVMLGETDLEVLGTVVGDENVDGVDTREVVNTVVGMTTGRLGSDSGGPMGHWSAQFFGNKRTDGHPAAVAGRFDLNADHITLSGAFGANNTKE